MQKESTSLYIFRLLINIGIFAFIIMLYWSSVLVEQDLKSLQANLSQIKSEFLSLRSDLNKLRHSSSKNGGQHSVSPSENTQEMISSHIDPSLPNLLTDDPFYTTTLPNMLGPDFNPKGIRREATIGKPHNLHPFTNWSEISSWITLCTVSIATPHFGIFETLAPEMAIKMELRKNKEGQPEYWLHLRQDIFWQPLNPEHFADGVTLAPMFLQKHQVTAHDFKFYWDVVMNPHVGEAQAVALRTYLENIQEIEVVDDFTMIVRWKTKNIKDEEGNVEPRMKYASQMLTASLRPLASFVYKYFANGTKIIPDDSDPNTYRTNPIWAQNFSHHWANNIIVSCGPWIFDGMTDREIRFKRNPDFYFPYAVLVEGYEVKFKDSPDSIWEEFKSGSLDIFRVPPNQLAEVERFLQSTPYKKQEEMGLGIRRLNFVDRAYYYVGWNQANPLFKSKKVRQALTMAIDRKRIIEHYLNGMGIEITGTFFRYSPSYDDSIIPYPFDLNKARALLAEEGWYDSDGDGTIDKIIAGKLNPFQFTLTYYVKNPITKSINEYIATTLKEVGVLSQIDGVDLADLSNKVQDKSFDAIYLGWGLGSPPEDPRQIWYSAGSSEKGSSNTIGFSNPTIDAIIDQLEYEYDPAKRIELYHRFDRILYDEAPYVFLYTPKAALIYREYLQNVFIPAERQDLIPGANVGEPQSSIFWIKDHRLESSKSE